VSFELFMSFGTFVNALFILQKPIEYNRRLGRKR